MITHVITLIVLINVISTGHICSGFYMPEGSPISYCSFDTDMCPSEVVLYVNRLNSVHTAIPYEYHHFDFCLPDSSEPSPVENLGQVVFGERIRPSPYKIIFGRNDTSVLCEKKYHGDDYFDQIKIEKLKTAIALNYQHHWIIDNMPVKWCYEVMDRAAPVYCTTGFPVGCYVDKEGRSKDGCAALLIDWDPDTYYIYNHVDIYIEYQQSVGNDWGMILPEGAGRIISARVVPRSILHIRGDVTAQKSIQTTYQQEVTSGDLTLQYSYTVFFKPNSNIKWSSRWDYILNTVSKSNMNIQWFSTFNSLFILLFLAALFLRCLWKTLRSDNKLEILLYSDKTDIPEKVKKDFGWMFVYGDVFRPPVNGLLLCVFLGTGVQLFIMTLITLFFAGLGYLSPANRGALMTSVLVLYVCLGIPAGYASSRIYKMFGGTKWKVQVLLTSLLCPGITFFMCFSLNVIYWSLESSAAMPVTTVLTLLGLLLGVSVPLTLVGLYLGYKKMVIEHPVKINPIARQIPARPIYRALMTSRIIGGILPFGCMFIQLFFILNSIWSHQMYYMYGFLFIVFIIFTLTCSLSTVLLCFIRLSLDQDYHWWWRSFLSAGFTAVFFFLYSIFYFVRRLEISDTVSAVLYFGYSAIIAFLIFLLSGTIGFFACFWFVRKIYSGRPLQSFLSVYSNEPFLISSKVEFPEKVAPQLASFDQQGAQVMAPPAYSIIDDVLTVAPPAYSDYPNTAELLLGSQKETC